jgi:hypothetical protein
MASDYSGKYAVARSTQIAVVVRDRDGSYLVRWYRKSDMRVSLGTQHSMGRLTVEDYLYRQVWTPMYPGYLGLPNGV